MQIKKIRKNKKRTDGISETSLNRPIGSLDKSITDNSKKVKKSWLIIIGSFLIILSFSILFLKYFNLYKNDEKEKRPRGNGWENQE